MAPPLYSFTSELPDTKSYSRCVSLYPRRGRGMQRERKRVRIGRSNRMRDWDWFVGVWPSMILVLSKKKRRNLKRGRMRAISYFRCTIRAFFKALFCVRLKGEGNKEEAVLWLHKKNFGGKTEDSFQPLSNYTLPE